MAQPTPQMFYARTLQKRLPEGAGRRCPAARGALIPGEEKGERSQITVKPELRTLLAVEKPTQAPNPPKGSA
jgi:hypothetical protein